VPCERRQPSDLVAGALSFVVFEAEPPLSDEPELEDEDDSFAPSAFAPLPRP
jgi:hypothetical protein